MPTQTKPEDLAAEVLEVCKARSWSLAWDARLAQLTSEGVELADALRGKRGSVLEEAGDVLFVLMSMTQNAGIDFDFVLAATAEKCAALRIKERYAGEEYNADTD